MHRVAHALLRAASRLFSTPELYAISGRRDDQGTITPANVSSGRNPGALVSLFPVVCAGVSGKSRRGTQVPRGRRVHAVAAMALSGVMLFAQQPAKAPDTAAIERGRSQFKSSCGFCHGDDATGNRAPDLLRSAVLLHDVNGDQVGPVIRNGKPDLGMPGFGNLTSAQVSDIVVFLHNQADEALHSNGVPRDYPLKKLLTGNADAGKEYFNGPGGCAKCHSVTGDLAGVARKYSPLDLQQHMIYPGGRSRVTATVIFSNGGKMEGPVVNNDEFDIAISGPDGHYHAWPKSAVKVELHDPLAAHRDLFTKYTDADIHNLFAYMATLK